jgi:diketogulonate reductase-like aldo/keto reductase
MSVPAIQLNDGHVIPQVALGLWQVTNQAEFDTMFDAAVKAGYRHFDTAQVYQNEQFLGEAIKRHGLKREDLFITTKIAPQHFGYMNTKRSFQVSLEKLQTDYVDLLLLHLPVPVLRKRSWESLEAIQALGQAKSIGVSNYTIRHLEKMKQYAKVTPAVNQVEQHVFLQQPELIKYCQDNTIVVEAYSPLAHARANDNQAIKTIAAKHDKSYAQIMLRWLVQNGYVVLPKSKTPSRIQENIELFDFELDNEDLEQLAKQNQNLHTCFPTKVAPWLP